MKKLLLFFAAASLLAQILVRPGTTITVATITTAPPLFYGCRSMALGVCVPTYVLTIPRPVDPMATAVRYKVSAVIDTGLAGYVAGAVLVPGIGDPSVTFTLGGSASEFTVETANLTATAESTATVLLQTGVPVR